MSRLLLAALAVALVNVPFGYWRAGQRKFSWGWLAAVHAPVPIVVAVRLLSGLGWAPHTYVVLIGAYFAGQLAGARLRVLRKAAQEPGVPR